MYGFAGTGKTTMIMEIVQFLIVHKQLRSVAFSAPTHKALNVMKTNFNKLIPKLISSFNLSHQESFDSNLTELSMVGITVNFTTIHSLLNYVLDFTNTGEKIFAKKNQIKKSKKTENEQDDNMAKYELIIIDECSMISIQMIIDLFNEIRKQIKNNNEQKSPKIIFTGDPAQLPPVNEISSSIFSKSKWDLSFTEYSKYVDATQGIFTTQEMIKNNYDQLMNDLTNMKTVTLKQIFRNSRSNVIDLSFNIRQWVLGEINAPTIKQYAGNGVTLYNSKLHNGNKLQSQWFNKCIETFKSNSLSNIILTWTNAQSDIYNDCIRKTLLGKTKIDKFEIGDVLILNDFYCFDADETSNSYDGTNEKLRFYTSEQLKILNIEINEKKCRVMVMNIPKCVQNLSNSDEIIKKFKTIVSRINNSIKKQYTVWKIRIARLGEYGLVNGTNNEATILVIHEKSKKQLEIDKNNVVKLIKMLTRYYQINNLSQFKTIEKNILKQLWRYWDNNFVSPFANVIFGYSITTHKAQGSTFDNVFVDAHDILKNTNNEEAKRCIYTSHTRCANMLHILV
jgi:hypothetical protein